MKTLRPYQNECVNIFLNKAREKKSCIIQLPTGMGKTVTFAKAISYYINQDSQEYYQKYLENMQHKKQETELEKRLRYLKNDILELPKNDIGETIKRGNKVLIAMFGEELIDQTINTLISFGIDENIIQKVVRNDPDENKQIWVASVPSISKKTKIEHSEECKFFIEIFNRRFEKDYKNLDDVIDCIHNQQNSGLIAMIEMFEKNKELIDKELKRINESVNPRLKMMNPDLIVIDEAHQSASDIFRRMINYYRRQKEISIIGFSATPTRTNSKEKAHLKEIYNEISYSYPIKRAMLEGYLSRPIYHVVESEVDLNGCKQSAGDFNTKELSKRANVTRRNESVIEKYLEIGGGKALMFCIDISHCTSILNIIRDKFPSISAFTVDAKTQKKDRDRLIEDFKERKPEENLIFVNCMVASVGFDCPDVKTIILARPTRSKILYLQQFGRGTRIVQGKKETFNVIDVADHYKEGVCNCLQTVFNLNYKENTQKNFDVVVQIERQNTNTKNKEVKAKKEFSQRDINLKIASVLFDMPIEIEKSMLAFYSPEEKIYNLSFSFDEYLQIKDNEIEYNCTVFKENKEVENFYDSDIKKVLKFVKNILSNKKETQWMWDKKKQQDWSNKPATEPQKECLRRFYPDLDCEKISKHVASQLLDAKFKEKDKERVTENQKRYLCYNSQLSPIEIDKLSKRAASKLISELKGQKK